MYVLDKSGDESPFSVVTVSEEAPLIELLCSSNNKHTKKRKKSYMLHTTICIIMFMCKLVNALIQCQSICTTQFSISGGGRRFWITEIREYFVISRFLA